MPVKESLIRVQFQRGQNAEFSKGYWDCEVAEQSVWTARENTTVYEVSTDKVIVRVEKKTGVLHFFDKMGNLLLKEEGKLPRQMELSGAGIQTWNYFNWPKNEKLWAKGILRDDLERVNGKARYISFGKKQLRMPLLLSDKGYGLGIAAEGGVMYCGISMYGQYIYTEGMKQMDYYFIYGGNESAILDVYKELTM